MDEQIYSLLARLFSFLSVFILVLGVKFMISAKKSDGVFSDPRLPFTFRGLGGEIRFLRALLGSGVRTLFPQKTRAVARDIQLAALSLAPDDVFAAQLLWGILFATAGTMFMILLEMELSYIAAGLVIAGLTGALLPAVQIQNLAQARLGSIRRDLPFAIDLISSAMAAGLDFTAAVRYYVERSGDSPLTQEFGVTLKMLELGNNRNDALKAMAGRLGIDEFRSLVNAVVQGTEMGASITDTLRINASEMRRVRVAAAERKAQRAPSLMMIPMALFIMPSVFIVIFVPIYLRVQSSGMAGLF
ncbi:MAG: type II secretion system F family protein [Lentisphaeria bacterium]|nr:type II secretion system F family protein [Lentisphaeria bacterium]